MPNQHCLTEISEEDRESILEYYKTGIGVDTLVKRGLSPYGHVVTQRVIRESKIPKMPRGNQVHYKPKCPDNKVCPRCKLEKPKEAFGTHCTNKDGLRSHCRKCRTEMERPGGIRRHHGISLEDYDMMFAKQKGLCACCGKPETSKKRKDRCSLSIDHDHKTGKVRQLLCHRCNVVLGLVYENPTLCELLRSYILKHKER
jgi:hypothetical protein